MSNGPSHAQRLCKPRDIRRRIRSVSSTAQITKAMQMVAASKMRKAQQAALAGRPFARAAVPHPAQGHHAGRSISPIRCWKCAKSASARSSWSPPTKGLCGALNSNLFRLAAQFDPQSTVFITAGRRAAQFIARTRRQLVAEFAYGDSPRFARPGRLPTCARDLS